MNKRSTTTTSQGERRSHAGASQRSPSHLRNRDEELVALGWKTGAARWLALVALHSGLFLRSQYAAFHGCSEATARRFVAPPHRGQLGQRIPDRAGTRRTLSARLSPHRAVRLPRARNRAHPIPAPRLRTDALAASALPRLRHRPSTPRMAPHRPGQGRLFPGSTWHLPQRSPAPEFQRPRRPTGRALLPDEATDRRRETPRHVRLPGRQLSRCEPLAPLDRLVGSTLGARPCQRGARSASSCLPERRAKPGILTANSRLSGCLWLTQPPTTTAANWRRSRRSSRPSTGTPSARLAASHRPLKSSPGSGASSSRSTAGRRLSPSAERRTMRSASSPRTSSFDRGAVGRSRGPDITLCVARVNRPPSLARLAPCCSRDGTDGQTGPGQQCAWITARACRARTEEVRLNDVGE